VLRNVQCCYKASDAANAIANTYSIVLLQSYSAHNSWYRASVHSLLLHQMTATACIQCAQQANAGYIYFSDGPIDRGTFDANNWEKGVYTEEDAIADVSDTEPAANNNDDLLDAMES
jgi:hypothetical protein